MNFKILNNKKKKEILASVNKKWGCDYTTENAFLISGERVYMVTRDLDKIDFENLRINAMGLFFGTLLDKDFVLSMEGSMLVGPLAKKNIVELSFEELRDWLKGQDLQLPKERVCGSGSLIVKSGRDYAGTAIYSKGILLNQVPKTRRILCAD
jgi:NOL1/NOP2/fmu family ribosome biogenesis protein